jgi:hypothetical protein
MVALIFLAFLGSLECSEWRRIFSKSINHKKAGKGLLSGTDSYLHFFAAPGFNELPEHSMCVSSELSAQSFCPSHFREASIQAP